MSLFLIFLSLLLSINISAKAEESGAYLVCDEIYIDSESIEFSQNEKSLICPSTTPGWGNIPRNQQLTQITIFLENRGYFQSDLESKEGKVFISLNKRSFIKKVKFLNAPKEFSRDKYRGVLGKPLTPENLSEIRKWSKGELSSVGYPCAIVQGVASFVSEQVFVTIEPEEKITIKAIEREKLENFEESLFQRYEAFNLGDSYNEDFLDLSSRRAIGDGLISYTYYQHDCKEPGRVFQNFIPRKPNTIIFGIGGSSEELPILKVDWRNSGLNRLGSQLYSSLYTSNREQKLEFGSELYLKNMSPRFSINPSIVLARRDEFIFESNEAKALIGFRYQQDNKSKRYTYRLVPSYSVENNIDSDLPNEIRLVQLASFIELTSNYFEYFRSSPREGFQLKFGSTSYESIKENFDANGQTFNLSGTYLWNLNSFDPPSFIMGTRFHYHTVVAQSLAEVPQAYRLYLGGQENIRGFGRNVINNNTKGFKTTSHLAFEGRFTSLLPYKLEPYLFYDIAKTSLESFNLSSITYTSPGIGLRYESPIGNFRFSLAKGRVDGDESNQKGGWNNFFSYGREF